MYGAFRFVSNSSSHVVVGLAGPEFFETRIWGALLASRSHLTSRLPSKLSYDSNLFCGCTVWSTLLSRSSCFGDRNPKGAGVLGCVVGHVLPWNWCPEFGCKYGVVGRGIIAPQKEGKPVVCCLATRSHLISGLSLKFSYDNNPFCGCTAWSTLIIFDVSLFEILCFGDWNSSGTQLL